MPLNARQYRDELYRLRAHPGDPARAHHGFVDRRDSFAGLYFSLIPFIALEYVAELKFDRVPSGLLFPLGYLLFWAFYYSLYKPGFLEEKLSEPRKWDVMAAPTILLGTAIWFVKVMVVELLGFITKTIVGPPRKQSAARPRPVAKTYQFDAHRRAQSAPEPLPREIQTALHVLGLKHGTDWSEIHKRYRQLAKQYHPDLNPEITAAGRRFMMYDTAYRKLYAVRARYFSERR